MCRTVHKLAEMTCRVSFVRYIQSRFANICCQLRLPKASNLIEVEDACIVLYNITVPDEQVLSVFYFPYRLKADTVYS